MPMRDLRNLKPRLSDGTEEQWSVFVGGSEVNDYLLDFDTALVLAQGYLEDDYNDICLMQNETGETVDI